MRAVVPERVLRRAPGRASPRPFAGAALLFGCALLAAPAPAAGKAITIAIEQSAEIRGDALVAHVRVRNGGDGAARAVRTTLRSGTRIVRGATRETLAPGASFDEELVLRTGPLGAGRWPYAIQVDYADVHLSSFQALLMATAVVGSPPPPEVALEAIQGEPMSTTGSVTVRARNLATSPRTVRYRVEVPEVLEVRAPEGTLEIPSSGETSLEVTLVNRSAPTGSQLPLFVVLDDDDGRIHQSVVSQGTIRIVEPPNVWARHQTLVLLAATIVVAMWSVLAVRQRTHRTA